MTETPPDAMDRRNAVFSSEAAVVWASAGTGKTHTLILRALHLVLELASDGLFSPHRPTRSAAALRAFCSLLLITFTRKAAAEMQTRLCRYFDLILQSPESGMAGSFSDPLFTELVEHWLQRCGGWDRLRAGIETLGENLTDAQIFTIHSYAAGLLSRYPLQAGLPADCRFAREDEDDLADFNDRLLDTWWKRRAFSDPETARHLDAVLQTLDFDELQAWLAAVLQHPWIVSRMPSMAVTETRHLPAVISALERMADLLQRQAGSKLNRLGRELADLLRPEPDWRRLAAFVIEHETYLFRKRNKSLASALAQLPGPLQMVLHDFTSLYDVLQVRAVASSGDGWAALESLLQRFRHWSQDAGVRELRLASFDDILRRAVRLLRDHPRVLAEERRRLRAVLVDEFQDTDLLQLELLDLLLGPASRNPPLGFLVGDPKQSIYRFRGADLVSVDRFCRSYTGAGTTDRPTFARQFHLRTTFRCSPSITRFVNRFFSRCVPLAQTEESQLSPASTGTGPLPIWFLIEPSPVEPSGVEAARERMASVLVTVIRDLVHKPESHVRHRFHEILVLGRSHRELDAILRGLQQAGIPAVSSGSRTFYRHPEVLDVVNLLICLHQPLDELATATVLRSPLVGVDDPVLARLIRDPGLGALICGRTTFPAWLPEPHRQRLLLLQELAATRSRLHPLEWLAQVFRFIPRTAYLRADDCEGRPLARVEKVLKAFGQELTEGVTPPLTWLLQQRERSSGADQRDAQLGEDVALTDESVDAVRVMTIHKAKGLESRVVIIFDWPGLIGPQARNDSRPAPVIALTTENGPRQEFQLPFAGLTVRSRGYAEALELDRRQDREETGRLAYVAATRARDLLILLQSLNGSEAEAGWLSSMETELGDCVQFVRHRREQGKEGFKPTAPPGIDLEAYLETWNGRFARSTAEPEPLILHPTGLPELDGPASETPAAAPAGEALAVGTLVHRYLEKYLHEGVFSAHRLADLDADGSVTQARETAAVLLARFFEGRLADNRGTALIDRVRRGRILARELPILFRYEGKTWQGVIDLVLEEAGTVCGVDFKTGHRTDPLPETYRRQSDVYRNALTRLFPGRPVDFEFWWLE